MWDLEGQPIGDHGFAFLAPPHHQGCRCVLSPVPKSLDAIFGTNTLDDFANSLSRRASMNGPVAGSTNYDRFLRSQSRECIVAFLGDERAELFMQGAATLRDFVDCAGETLPLPEVRQRIGLGD